MNLLGMGPAELILIAVLGLIVFGPGKLPEIAGQVGRAIRDFRHSTQEVQAEFQRSFSLDEPPASAPAAGVASLNGATTAVAETQETVTAPEPPLADTSEWNWEGSGEQQAVASEPTARSSFWEWDSAEQEAKPAEQPAQQIAATGSSLWEWDDAGSEAVIEPQADPTTATAVDETQPVAPVAVASDEAPTLTMTAPLEQSAQASGLPTQPDQDNSATGDVAVAQNPEGRPKVETARADSA